MDVRDYNRKAWDKLVEQENEWTIPVMPDEIASARAGEWKILLTETKPAPRAWFPQEMKGLDILCLASGGGQQAPILAATGANVIVLDNSPNQLAQDFMVAFREGLEIKTVEGDMRDLSAFEDESFDLIFHPVSNLFVPDVRPVWRECYRVLRRGGALLAGFNNPVLYIFDEKKADMGLLEVRHKLPYSDIDSVTDEERNRRINAEEPVEFSHTLEDQIGGQLEAGFVIAGFYEDSHRHHPLSQFAPTYIATRAIKP